MQKNPFENMKGRKITPLGKYIREIRVKNDITLLDMANALGMKPSELCGIETGDIEKPKYFECAVSQYFSGLDISFDPLRLFMVWHDYHEEKPEVSGLYLIACKTELGSVVRVSEYWVETVGFDDCWVDVPQDYFRVIAWAELPVFKGD